MHWRMPVFIFPTDIYKFIGGHGARRRWARFGCMREWERFFGRCAGGVFVHFVNFLRTGDGMADWEPALGTGGAVWPSAGYLPPQLVWLPVFWALGFVERTQSVAWPWLIGVALSVSRSYLSLLEKGTRPLTGRRRLGRLACRAISRFLYLSFKRR